MKMKKKLFALFASLTAAILLFSACTSKDDWIPAGMKLASSDAVDFTMFVPETWTVDISTGVVSAYVSDIDRTNVTMMAFNLENEDAAMTPSDYWAHYEEELFATFSDLSYIDPAAASESDSESTAVAAAETSAEGETTQNKTAIPISVVLDKTAANKYVYTATVTGTEYKFMQVVAVRGGIVYIFTFTSSPEGYDTHLADAESVLEYFYFNR